jgi:hypothetical protein
MCGQIPFLAARCALIYERASSERSSEAAREREQEREREASEVSKKVARRLKQANSLYAGMGDTSFLRTTTILPDHKAFRACAHSPAPAISCFACFIVVVVPPDPSFRRDPRLSLRVLLGCLHSPFDPHCMPPALHPPHPPLLLPTRLFDPN